MTTTNEDLLALAKIICAAMTWPSDFGWSDQSDQYRAKCMDAARCVLVTVRRSRTRIGGDASVAVCPICDIAGCHHIRDAERQAIRDKAMDDAGVTAARLEDLENNLWNLCNSIDDEDWIGQPEGLTEKVVGHFEKYHRMHVEMLERAARQVAAIRAMKGKLK